MELSRIIQQFAPALSREERGLVTALPEASTAFAAERYKQQMKNLADAKSLLEQLPDKKSSERQDKSEKARMLKERLKMLKQMIPFMSPAAAKSLKVELKQIASQLASLGAEGGGTPGGLSTAAAVAVTDTAQAAAPAGSATEADDTNAGGNTPENGTAPEKTTAGPPEWSDRSGLAMEKGQDRQLQETLEELKQLYRSVRNMVQRKLQQAGDKGETAPELPPQLQAYMALPESGAGVTLKV